MGNLSKEIIKEQTVFLWLALAFGFALPLMIADSILVLVLYDCWPFIQGHGNCFAQVPGFQWHLATVFAATFSGATLTTRRIARKKR